MDAENIPPVEIQQWLAQTRILLIRDDHGNDITLQQEKNKKGTRRQSAVTT